MTDLYQGGYTGEQIDSCLTLASSNLSLHKITRSVTFTIAASDSSAKEKAQADYVCTGTNDNVTIQAALDALPSTGGEIYLCEGNYVLGATLSRAINSVTITGAGYSTYLAYNADSFVINFGAQNNWVLQNLRVDYGGFSIGTGKGWTVTNVYKNCKYYEETVHIDQWAASSLGAGSQDNIDSVISSHPLIHHLDNIDTGWTTSGTGASAVQDTTIVKKGSASTKFTTMVTSTTNLVKTMSVPDMTDAGMSFWIYTPDYTKISSIQVALQYNGVWNTDIYRDQTNFGCIPTVSNRWVKFTIPFFTKGGNASPTNLTAIRIAVGPASGQQAVVYLNDMCIWKNKVLLPTGAVSFAFDDGCDSIFTIGKPKLDLFGYKGNWAPVLDRIKGNGNTLGWAKLMQNDGWDIINHSVSHDQPRMLLEPMLQYSVPQKWLVDNGFKPGARFVSLCFGVYDATVLEFTDMNMAWSMSTLVGENSLPDISHLIKVRGLGAGTVATAKTYVDSARTNGTLTVFMIHDLVASNPTSSQSLTSEFNDLIDYIAASGVEVLTYSQLAARIENLNISTTGSATLPNGSTTVNVRHGFHRAPSSIQITPTSSLGSASSIWVSSKDSGTGNLFTVSVNVNPGADVTFDWEATL